MTLPPVSVPRTAPTPYETNDKPPIGERIAVLDILRGLALVGMFMVHFNYYEATPLGTEPGRAAALVEQVLTLFFRRSSTESSACCLVSASRSSYLLHIVLLEVFFTPHGLGLKIPALLVFPAALAMFAAQVLFSRWWLSRFRYGPLEWIWRCATDWSIQPIRLTEPAAEVRLAA